MREIHDADPPGPIERDVVIAHARDLAAPAVTRNEQMVAPPERLLAGNVQASAEVVEPAPELTERPAPRAPGHRVTGELQKPAGRANLPIAFPIGEKPINWEGSH